MIHNDQLKEYWAYLVVMTSLPKFYGLIFAQKGKNDTICQHTCNKDWKIITSDERPFLIRHDKGGFLH